MVGLYMSGCRDNGGFYDLSGGCIADLAASSGISAFASTVILLHFFFCDVK